MSAQHRAWLADQAAAFARQQHERVLRDSALAFAHPSPDVTRAARALRTKLDERRLARDLDRLACTLPKGD